jgi:hypothetical protein
MKVGREMYAKELKERVEHDTYVVDAYRVAEALLRRAADRHVSTITVARHDARDRIVTAPIRRPPA